MEIYYFESNNWNNKLVFKYQRDIILVFMRESSKADTVLCPMLNFKILKKWNKKLTI